MDINEGESSVDNFNVRKLVAGSVTSFFLLILRENLRQMGVRRGLYAFPCSLLGRFHQLRKKNFPQLLRDDFFTCCFYRIFCLSGI